MLSPLSPGEHEKRGVDCIYDKVERLVDLGIPAPRAMQAVARTLDIEHDKVEFFWLLRKLHEQAD
jgi:hypothetical protein